MFYAFFEANPYAVPPPLLSFDMASNLGPFIRRLMKKHLVRLLLVAIVLGTGWSFLAGALAQTLPDGTRKLADLAYVEGGHERQKLDLYLPSNAKGVPLVVWIHGGGWTGGSKERPPGLALLGKGYALASLDYRFSTEAIFPAQIQDCKAALRWLRAHASEYGYDPAHIGVWGGSAGGHLVALLAVTGQTQDFEVGANLAQSSAVQCAVDWFGPTDFLAFNAPDQVAAGQKRGSALTRLLGGDLSTRLDLARQASPVTWVTKQAAPLLIMHGTRDELVPVDQSQRFYDKLKAVGADATLDLLGGAGHGGGQFTAAPKLELIGAFLSRHLRPAPQPSVPVR